MFVGKKQPNITEKNARNLKTFNSEVMKTFIEKFMHNARILKSPISVSNFKLRVEVSVSKFLIKSRSLSRRFNQVSVSKVTVSTTSLHINFSKSNKILKFVISAFLVLFQQQRPRQIMPSRSFGSKCTVDYWRKNLWHCWDVLVYTTKLFGLWWDVAIVAF